MKSSRLIGVNLFHQKLRDRYVILADILSSNSTTKISRDICVMHVCGNDVTTVEIQDRMR